MEEVLFVFNMCSTVEPYCLNVLSNFFVINVSLMYDKTFLLISTEKEICGINKIQGVIFKMIYINRNHYTDFSVKNALF